MTEDQKTEEAKKVEKVEPSAQNLKGEYERKLEQERQKNEEAVQANETMQQEIDKLKAEMEIKSDDELAKLLDEKGVDKEEVDLIMKEVDRRNARMKKEIQADLNKEKEYKSTRVDLLSKNELYAKLPKEQKDEVNAFLDTCPSSAQANPMGIKMAINDVIVTHMGDVKGKTEKVKPPSEPGSDTKPVDTGIKGVSDTEVKETKGFYNNGIEDKQAAEVKKSEKDLEKEMFSQSK